MFGELENLSAEDKQFMIMMENGAGYVNSHYRLPLPLRNPALIVPNNRAMVEKRANYLKKRFMKNQEFFEDYRKSNHMIRHGAFRTMTFIIPVNLEKSEWCLVA